MLLDFWLAAHESALSEMIASIRPRRLTGYFRLIGLSIVTAGVPGVMFYEQFPGRRSIVFIELGIMLGALTLCYLLKMVHYPASRVASYRLEIAKLRKDLGQRRIAESCIVALSEFLSEMNGLQNAEVRSQAQYQDWQRDYQTTVQSTYTLISKGISNTAALSFVSYPVSEVRYWRGAFSDDHSKMKSMLDKYTIKLRTIIEGHYLAMRHESPARRDSPDETVLGVVA